MNKTKILALLKEAFPVIVTTLLLILVIGGGLAYALRGLRFASPVFLYCIPFVLLMAGAGAAVKHLTQPVLDYPLPSGLQIKTSFGAQLVKWLPFSLITLALILCFIALARPRQEGRQILPPTQGIDIMITVDVSGSMAANDLKPNRLAAAKETADDFVKKRSSDRVGVVVFAGAAMLQCPLTLDYFAVHDYIKLIYLDMVPEGGTAVGDAIAVASLHLKSSTTKSKIIILITDGESNSGTVDPMSAAKAAAAYGIKVYTIGVAGDGKSVAPVQTIFGYKNVAVPELTQKAEAALVEISKTTGGKFFRARNNIELQNIYETINKLEKTDFKEVISINYEDKYRAFLYGAVLLLLLSLILDKFVFIKIP